MCADALAERSASRAPLSVSVLTLALQRLASTIQPSVWAMQTQLTPRRSAIGTVHKRKKEILKRQCLRGVTPLLGAAHAQRVVAALVVVAVARRRVTSSKEKTSRGTINRRNATLCSHSPRHGAEDINSGKIQINIVSVSREQLDHCVANAHLHGGMTMEFARSAGPRSWRGEISGTLALYSLSFSSSRSLSLQ